MANIIGGFDTGLFDSSLYLLNRNDRTGASDPGHGEGIYANVADGNLVVTRQDAYLPSEGIDFELIRSYNSRGAWNGGAGKGWTLSAGLQLTGISSSQITLINQDSSRFKFTFSSSTGKYQSVDGEGAYQTITYNSSSSTYTLVA